MTKNQFQEMELEESWEEIKRVTSKTKEQHLRTEGKRQAKKRKNIREAKEQYMTKKCKKTEDLNSRHDTFNVHKKIKKATGRYKKQVLDTIKTNDGELVIKIERKFKVWQKYIEKLFEDTERPQREYFPETEGSEITESEGCQQNN
ncbi:hypothetical protein ILUMI_05322 [Ignelater luminosus]|uniref:Uncharacterized protein n=1 Tax=Ignelater luminosus TaxID=2038154 RepID=A0A8K0D7H9_IGNLU|nr:hypothetical protein ILUMI_05322 [Ignelater luminosus]